MSLMSFREKDKARRVGVRPAHEGTQIAKDGTANNNTVIIHTVTAGKVFYLVDWSMCMVAGATNQISTLHVRDASDVFAWYIHILRSAGSANLSEANSLFYPQEIPAGYDVCVSSDNVGMISYAHIHGWEE